MAAPVKPCPECPFRPGGIPLDGYMLTAVAERIGGGWPWACHATLDGAKPTDRTRPCAGAPPRGTPPAEVARLLAEASRSRVATSASGAC